MDNRKENVAKFLEEIRIANLALVAGLTSCAFLTDYEKDVCVKDGRRIWTKALQRALYENQVVMIPSSEEPYYIDAPVTIPSNRHIEAAPDATIRLCPECRTLMLRNENTQDGTHMPIDTSHRNSNISINGGRWEESNTVRKGYGATGLYDMERSFFGVSTCMLFNNIENLTLTNMVFAHTAAFSLQLGDAKNVVMENIRFESCYADGIHVNGNTENLLIRNISGEVGDDLVALNTYDWQDSSVNFGPGKCILCENIAAFPTGGYKSMRLEQGIYRYADGTEVDCSLTDALIRNVSGVHTFKLYYQTPAYAIGTEPEYGAAGSMSRIFFEDIHVDLQAPVDDFDAYTRSDPLRGWFGAFELGSNIDRISFENIRFTLYPDQYPLSRPIIVGPKSIRVGEMEVFDPYISNTVGCLEFKDITVNGQPAADPHQLIHITRFDNINGDGRSSGQGEVTELILR